MNSRHGWRRSRRTSSVLARQVEEVVEERSLVAVPADGILVLEEKRQMKVEVLGVPLEGLAVVRLNRKAALPDVRKGICQRRCDYFLVATLGGQEVAVIVELKKTLYENEDDWREQLRRSLPRLRLLELMGRIHASVDPEGTRTRVEYCLLAEKGSGRLDKQPTRPWVCGEARVERYEGIRIKKFVGGSVPFRKLVQ